MPPNINDRIIYADLERQRADTRSTLILEHDLFAKPASTFPDHALSAVLCQKMRW
jgi:hypothetical protein